MALAVVGAGSGGWGWGRDPSRGALGWMRVICQGNWGGYIPDFSGLWIRRFRQVSHMVGDVKRFPSRIAIYTGSLVQLTCHYNVPLSFMMG